MEIRPIAYIHNGFKEKFGIPRQSGKAASVVSKIIFEPEFRDLNALSEIEGFSHLWLLFDFSLAHKEGWSPTVRPPRLGGNKRVGVFASRSPFRPNNIGLSAVKLIGIEHSKDCGAVLSVSGADLLDGTPIYDIKPYIPYADCIPDAAEGYTKLTKDYRLKVDFPEELILKLPETDRIAVTECLAEDPRPSYQNDAERIYTMSYGDFDISFKVRLDTLIVTSVQPNINSKTATNV